MGLKKAIRSLKTSINSALGKIRPGETWDIITFDEEAHRFVIVTTVETIDDAIEYMNEHLDNRGQLKACKRS